MIYLPTPIDGECHDCGDDPCGDYEGDICSLELDTEGRDEGYHGNYSVHADYQLNGGWLSVWHNHYSRVPDRVELIANTGETLYDSTCVTGDGTENVFVPAGVTSITVRVTPHCSPEYSSGTLWQLRISCIDSPP